MKPLVMIVVAAVAAGTSGPPQRVRPAARSEFCDPATGCPAQQFHANSAESLYRIDLAGASPTVTLVGALGTQITDIATCPDGRIFGVSFTALYEISPQTGHATPIGAHGSRTANGLTCATGHLQASSTNGQLLSLDPSSGRGRPSFPAQGSGMVSSSGDLVFHGGALLMTSPSGPSTSSADVLVRLEVGRGRVHVIGNTGLAHVYGLVSVGADLLGLTDSGAIVRIDPQTGATAPIAQTSIPFWGAG